MWYILGPDGEPVRVGLDAYDQWRSENPGPKTVARDQVGDVEVSTIFTAFDYGFGCTATPILYETMIFGGPSDLAQWRHYTAAEALEFHARAVRAVSGNDYSSLED